MSSFTNALIAEDTGDGSNWLVYVAFVFFGWRGYLEKIKWAPERVSIPKGFKTDFASVPWFVRWAIAKLGKGNQGAVVHDALYRRGFIEVWNPQTEEWEMRLITRKEADEWFLKAYEVLGVSKARRYSMYYGLRVGGQWGWYKARKMRAANQDFYHSIGRVWSAYEEATA